NKANMRVIDPKQLEQRRNHRAKKHKKKRSLRVTSGVVIALTAVYVLAVLVMPLPSLRANTSDVTFSPSRPITVPWPGYGQAAIGAVGYGLLDQHGAQTQLPTASVAKVITAVTVLKIKPLLI